MRPLPVRGTEVRSLGLALPPARMPLLSRGRPLKRWRYVALYRPDLMVCVGDARVAGLPQRWWALALPDGTLAERTTAGRGGIDLSPGRRARGRGRRERGPDVRRERGRGGGLAERALVDLDAQAGAGAPARDACASASASGRWTATRASSTTPPATTSATPCGAGRRASGALVDGRAVAWNLVDGVHDAPESSERTVWVDGVPGEVPPLAFADDLSRVGGLEFTPWSAREDHTRRLLFRSDYLQPFGSFEGELPGGLRLASGHGVMEWHDVRW